MAGQKFTLTFDAQLNVSQMKGSLSQIQSALNGLHLPQNITKGLQGSFDNLSKEIQGFEAALSKDITSKADFNKLNKQAEKVTSAFEKLKLQVRDITGLSNKDLERLLPSNIVQNINKATKAMDQYDKSTTQAANKVKEIQTEVEKLNQKIANANNKTPITDIEWKQLNAAIKEASNEVQQYKTELANAEENQKRIANSLKEPSKSSTWRAARDEVAALTQKLEEAKNKIKELSNQKATSITFAKQAEDLNKFNTALAEAQGKLRAAEQALAILQSDSAKGGLKELIDQVSQLTGLDLSNFKGNIEDLRNVVRAFAAGEVDKLKGGFDQLRGSVDGATPAMRDFSDAMRQGSAEADQLDARMRDVSALKSRIQYFFGLNNTINLFRRAVRGAFETIKELDKAMTETAVVTKFSVGDMWEQLPEYTKRANELGVTTKAAYEAATLYYQQGLTTKEVNELSVETLKMARIAGLDAAEATDRMTNALRGFNMELNDVNAQRVDDVYSKLAAISASNVDEISTAMTKVASLAHNAGMEFETTAAFLAQIIETTRESAETAGTALKTVVARFAEVKKLVSEGDIKGQDEEGDLIDVNKVSAALRTAGIDLNRYFLGEVGIDDIFLELAKKWNELTSLQQRYIATQAAGSRQQSRFIALMADYARTQELVSAAYNANGAAAEQFGKTQESLESKLARLKNAWNEFQMGLTNSTVVKAGVDILTTLLNVVNKLTGAFGEGVGSVLKWTAAIAALRGIGSFVSAGGGLTKIIGALTGGAGLAAGGLGAGLGLGTKTLGKAAWGGAKNLGTLLYGIGNNAAAGGAGWLFGGAGVTGSVGMAAGLAGILTALTGIGVAIGGVILAYKTWEKFTPQGQLKAATKLAEQMEENARKANEVAESYKNVQESYKQYEDAIKEATNTTERDAAIRSKNDYILSLLEKDPSYAQYITSNRENGQIELVLNEEKFADAAKTFAEEAAKANVDSYFANANQQDKQFEVSTRRSGRARVRAENLEASYEDASDLRAEEIAQKAAAEAARAAADNYARLGYQELLKDSFLSDDVVNNLATALGSVYNKTGRINDDTLAELQAWASSASAQRIISTMAGDIGNVNLHGMDEDAMLVALGIDETSDEFKDLATTLNGFDRKELKKFIANIAQANQEIQENNRQRLNEKLNKAGIDQNTIDNFLNNATPDLQQAAIDAWDQIEQLINNGDYTNLADALIDPNTTVERIEEIRTAAMGINLNNPISAFAKLQDGINSTDKDIKKISEDILQSNHDIFNTGNLVQTALTNTYEDTKQVHKEIDKLIDKNGHISADNIRDLAEESEDLATIIDEDVTSVEALAKALTLIADGRLEMEDLNDTVITLLENMYTFDDLVQDVHDVIANFDEGIDYGEGVDFLVDKVFELEELFDNWEFGNERTERLWNLFFSEDYRDAWDNNEDELKARVQRLKAWLDNDAYGFFNDPVVQKTLTGEITPAGDHKLNWDLSKYNTLEDVLDDITKKFQVSTDAAKMFVEAFVSHGDEDVLEQFDRLGRNSAIKSVVDMATTNKHFWTKEEIDQIAKTAGMDADELLEAVRTEITTRNREDGLEINLADMFYVAEGPLSSEDFFKQFKDGLLQSGQNFDEWLGTFVERTEDGTSLKLTALKRALSQMGYGEAEQADLIDQFQKQLSLDDEEIAVNNLKIKIAGITGIEPESEAMKQLLTDLDEILSEKINNEDPKAIVDLLRVAFKDNGFELTTESYPAFIEWLQAKLSEGDENGNKPSVDIDKLTANPIFSKLEEGTQLIAYQKISELLMTNGPVIQLTDLICNPSFGSLDPAVQGTILESVGTLITDEDSLVALQGLIASPTFTTLAPGSQIQVFTDLANLIKKSGHLIPLDGLLGLLTNLQLEDPETNIPKVIEAITSSIIENGGTINLNNLKGKLGTLGIEPDDIDSFVALIQTWIDDKGNWILPEINTSNWDTQIEEKISAWKKLWESLSSPDFGGGSPALGGAKAADLRVDTTQAENATNNLAEQTGDALNNSTNTGIVTGVTEGTEESKKKFDEVAQEIAGKIKSGELSIEEAAEEIFKYTDNQAEQSQILEIVRSKLFTAGYNGAIGIVSQIQNQLNSTEFQVRVRASITSGAGAAGGTVSSRASGGHELKAGPALTGEEAPEIVWNKERGYAYITGQNGPEFRQLNPGDRVFNAAETRRIFRNSLANGGLIASYATGRWNPANDGNVLNHGKKTSGGSSGSSSNPTVWENDLDWLYNLMEDIAELERQQTRLSEQHDRYLKDISKTGRDLYNTTKEQLNNLYTARSNQIEALTRRRQEMSEQIGISGYGNYVWWNDKDQTIEIDWDAIEAIQDKDTYDEVKDLVSRVEKIQDEMDSAQDALWDIEGQIKELEERYLQEFVNFQQRVLDAVVNQYQKQIDDLSSLNDTLNDTNSRILDSISKEIDLERQIRDNTDTENNIADMEARLAYLRRDTTGANDSAIRDLEKQLSEARENYADTLIDQQLNRLSEANEKAADQREQQIALMTAQLEYWQETGALWQEVSQLMDEGFNSDGSLIGGSKLEEALKNAEDWKAMSEQQREVWGNELITSANQAGAYLLKISEGLDSLSAGVWAMLPSSSVTSQKLQYATGGLNKATGWAWLDGTANEPEYVLNARQTDAFLRLSEILPSMFNSGTVTNNNLGGNVYVELTMNVSDISSDYDVDRFMDRVKTNIYDAASYRNTVGLNFMK